MIVSLEGHLVSSIPLSCVLEVNGIGYEIFVPLTVDLPKIGEIMKLWIYAIYREDNHSLYGFNRIEERDFFKLIVDKVSGIGPKTALAMLSKFKLADLSHFIALKDVTMLASIPGIGKKTAEKTILELSDKVGNMADRNSAGIIMKSQCSDAILGLIALGYKRSDAETMIIKIAKNLPDAPADQLIKSVIAIR